MNNGAVFGYYLDEEKQKYFKIQPNHVAPVGAKYSTSEVNHEKRQAKKRRTESQAYQNLHKQTVQRSRILEAPLNGRIGLRRELGIRSSWDDSRRGRDAAVLSGLIHGQTAVMEISEEHFVRDAVLLEGQMLCGMTETGKHLLSAWSLAESHWPQVQTQGPLLQAFNSPVTSIATRIGDGMIKVVACTQGIGKRPNIYVASMPRDHVSMKWDFSNRVSECKVQLPGTTLIWNTVINRYTGDIAISSELSLVVMKAHDGAVQTAVPDVESPASDWLDSTVLAYAGVPGNREVKLWDARSRDSVKRFKHRERITGIRASDASGVHLLVSGNRTIGYYDTRWHTNPILSIPHRHEGPKIELATNGETFVAVDQHEDVHAYSLRTGQVSGTLQQQKPLGRSQAPRGKIRGLRWHDSSDGPSIYACQGGRLVNWAWGSDGDKKVEDD